MSLLVTYSPISGFKTSFFQFISNSLFRLQSDLFGCEKRQIDAKFDGLKKKEHRKGQLLTVFAAQKITAIAPSAHHIKKGFHNLRLAKFQKSGANNCIVQFIIENGNIPSLAVALCVPNAAMIINRASAQSILVPVGAVNNILAPRIF